jgi:acyl-CoA thioester hydrolase
MDHMTHDALISQLRLWRGEVLSDWLDYNGHMTEHRYLQVFGESSDAIYGRIGVDFAHASDGAFFTLATFISHLAECKLDTKLYSETEILGYDQRFIHLFHRLYDETGKPLAEGEHLAIHVRNGKAGPASLAVQSKIAELFAAQIYRPMPEGAGKVLKRPLENSRLSGPG